MPCVGVLALQRLCSLERHSQIDAAAAHECIPASIKSGNEREQDEETEQRFARMTERASV
jgi:hypothetical protein